MTKTILILGCGFAGLEAARCLKGQVPDGWKVVLVDEHDFFTFIPSIYKVAAAQMDEKRIIFPIRTIMKRLGVEFVQNIVIGIDPAARKVTTRFRRTFDYDYLLLTLGSKTHFFGAKGTERCMELKTIEHALRLREAMLEKFMHLKIPEHPTPLRVVVVGGGFTGVETVCALREYASELCEKFGVEEEKMAFTLLEAAPFILGQVNEKARQAAERRITKMRIDVRKNMKVEGIDDGTIHCAGGADVPFDICVWVAGIKPKEIVETTNSLVCGPDKRNVDETMQALGSTTVFGAGDNVICSGVPRTAYHAIKEGETAAKNILRQIGKKDPVRYRPIVSPLLISLGKKRGLFVYKDFTLGGRSAMWLKRLVEWHYVFTRKHF